MVDEKYFLGLLLDGSGDPLAVAGSKNQDSQDQQVEGPLKQCNAVILGSSGRHPTTV
jgi:hypothetical protein